MSEGVAAQLRKLFDLHMKKHDGTTSFAISIVKSDVWAVLANHICADKQELQDLPNPPCFDIFDIVQGTIPQETFDALERFEKQYTAWLDKVMPYLKGGGVEAT